MVPVVFACCRCTLHRFERTASDQGFEDSGGEPVVVTNQIKAEALHNIIWVCSTHERLHSACPQMYTSMREV